jgi:hypothetical protein
VDCEDAKVERWEGMRRHEERRKMQGLDGLGSGASRLARIFNKGKIEGVLGANVYAGNSLLILFS